MNTDWPDAVVSADGTHHRVDGRPLYEARFLEVLPFHAPGLAPARDATGAFHIGPDGRPAYAARFQRTFGFYEGAAAVSTRDGWFHIQPDGTPISSALHLWCGNFQGGRCVVRDAEGYYHVRKNDSAVYGHRWAYAGDFREQAAVVQDRDGLHGHIDVEGEPLHPYRYLDLDVFHKGFARARDRQGWHHVNRRGEAIYDRRFASVEPFYNGRARVEDFDGALLVIAETGEVLWQLRQARGDSLHAVSRDIVGFWRTQARMKVIATEEVLEFGLGMLRRIFDVAPSVPVMLAGGAFKTLLHGRPPRDLDLWVQDAPAHREVVRHLQDAGAEVLRDDPPYQASFQIGGLRVEVTYPKAPPRTFDETLRHFDIGLSAIGVACAGGIPEALVRPEADESMRRREVLLIHPLLNWKYALFTLERMERYGRELGFEVPDAEVRAMWDIYRAQEPEEQRRMISRYQRVGGGDPRIVQEALRLRGQT